MGNLNKNSKYFTIYLNKPYYYNNDEVFGTIVINDIKNIELIEGSLKLDSIEKWEHIESDGEDSYTVTLNQKNNKKYLPINLKKIINDNDKCLNYKIPFNFKFFDLEPTFIKNNNNYIKTVLTFELLGKYIRNGKKDIKPKKEKYDSFLTIKRESNYNNLYFLNTIEGDIKTFISFQFSTNESRVSIKTEKTQFDVEEEIPFEVNIENNLI